MNDHAIALDGAVWLTVGGEKFGGADRVALLRALAASGSITQAAKSLKISYKAAWDAIDAMNNLAGVALVERTTGGKGGGLAGRIDGRQVNGGVRLLGVLVDLLADFGDGRTHLGVDAVAFSQNGRGALDAIELLQRICMHLGQDTAQAVKHIGQNTV